MCKIVDFPQNCEIETVVTCSTIISSCHGLAPSFFDDMTRRRRQKHYVSEITTNAPPAALRLTAAPGDRTARCRRQEHHRRWSSNPNGRSKFRNLFVHLSKIATNASAAALRLTEIVQTACCRRRKHAGGGPAMTRIDRNTAITKIYAYEIKKTSWKIYFCC